MTDDLPTKEGIKLWLRRTGKTRKWLADQCSVSSTTVNGWLAPGKPISKKILLTIKALMMDEALCGVDIQPIEVNLTLRPNDFVKYSNAAGKSKLTLSEWITRALDDACEKI